MFQWLWANAEQLGQVLALVGTASAAVVGAARFLMMWSKKQLKAVVSEEFTGFRESIGALSKSLAEVQLEFKPNGGNSLRDQVMFTKNGMLAMLAWRWALVDSLGDPMWEADAAGLWTRANKAMLTLTHRPQDQLAGTNWENAIHHEDRAKVWEEWSDAVMRKRTFEMTFRLASAREVSRVDAIATPILDGATVTGWLGKLRKIEQLS